MEPSKEFRVMKSLIEQSLRRDNTQTSEQDVKLCLRVMSSMIDQDTPILVIADAHRIANDFGQVFRRSFTFVDDANIMRGLHGFHLIVLHSGHRTEHQTKRYIEQRELARQLSGRVTVWHVGRWR